MEVITENNNGSVASKLTESQKSKRRALKKKLNANLGLLEKGQDTENPKSKPEVQDTDNPNTGIGTSATVDKKMSVSISSPAGTGDGKRSVSEGKEHTKVVNGVMGSSMTIDVNGEVEVQKKMETSSGTNATDNTALKKRKREKKNILSIGESTQEGSSTTKVLEVKSGETVSAKTAVPDANMVSKEQDHAEAANGKTEESETTYRNVNGAEKRKNKPHSMNKRLTLGEILNPQYSQSLEASKGETGSGATSINDSASKKQKRQKLNKNLDLGDILSTRESTQEGLSTTKILEVKNGETVSAKTAPPDANIVSKGDHTEVSNGKTGESETTNNGNGAPELTKSQKRNRRALKKKLNANLGLSEKREDTENPKSKPKVQFCSILQSSLQDNPNTGTGTSATVDKMISMSTQAGTGDGKSSNSKGKEHTKVANGEMGSRMTTNLNGEVEAQKKMETSSGTDATENTALEKRKRKKRKNNNPDLGDILNTRESTQEGLSMTQDLGVKCNEIVSGKTITPDANMVSKEQDHTEVAKGKTGESETTNVNVNGKEKRDKKPISKNKRPTLGEILNPHYLQNLEAARGETDSGMASTGNPASHQRKREKMKNNNPDLGDILSTRVRTQEGSSTTKVLEVKSDETVSANAAALDASMVSKGDHSEVANGKTGESETTNLNVNGKKKRRQKSKKTLPTLGENLNPLYLQNLKAAKHETCSGTPASGDNLKAVSGEVSQGKKHMKDANIKMCLRPRINLRKDPVKKLIILDVNGLLADVVSERPKDIIADTYIRGKAIFKRPYLNDFLNFCFERFHVAIWSSRMMKNLNPVAKYLLGNLKRKLLLLWDGCRCTDSNIKTLEDKRKHVVMKDLRKVWDYPNESWVQGNFNESNTLLVDDSPYKALLNPKHTGIFPASYSYKNADDNFLAPKGEFQTYLEGLAAADDVRKYVEQHPLGQGVIDEQNPHWDFYSSVLERLNDEPLMERLLKKNQWKMRKCCKFLASRKRRRHI